MSPKKPTQPTTSWRSWTSQRLRSNSTRLIAASVSLKNFLPTLGSRQVIRSCQTCLKSAFSTQANRSSNRDGQSSKNSCERYYEIVTCKRTQLCATSWRSRRALKSSLAMSVDTIGLTKHFSRSIQSTSQSICSKLSLRLSMRAEVVN